MMRDAWEEQAFAPEQVESLMLTKSSLQTGDLLFDEKSVVDSYYVVLGGKSRSRASTALRRSRLGPTEPGTPAGSCC